MQAKIWGQASFEAKREARPGQVLEYATPINQSYYIPEVPAVIIYCRVESCLNNILIINLNLLGIENSWISKGRGLKNTGN